MGRKRQGRSADRRRLVVRLKHGALEPAGLWGSGAPARRVACGRGAGAGAARSRSCSVSCEAGRCGRRRGALRRCGARGERRAAGIAEDGVASSRPVRGRTSGDPRRWSWDAARSASARGSRRPAAANLGQRARPSLPPAGHDRGATRRTRRSREAGRRRGWARVLSNPRRNGLGPAERLGWVGWGGC